MDLNTMVGQMEYPSPANVVLIHIRINYEFLSPHTGNMREGEKKSLKIVVEL